MRSTTATFKQIMAAGTARNYLFNIVLTLADNTQLTLTQDEIWQDSFCIDTASSSTSSFDIGCAIIGKCSFTINNIEGDYDGYDFFNATAVVWVGLEGDVTSNTQNYYRMGFYTVDEPQKANGLISLTLLDNMWKFDRPFENVTINYPATALSIVQALCSYCGVQLAGTSANFHGYNFSIAAAPQDVSNMNCREMLQYVAMIGCNFCVIDDTGKLQIKWYDTSATASTTDVFDRNMSTSFGTEDIEITGVKFVIDDTAHSIGSAGYVLELDNPLVTASNVNSVLNLIWDVLDGFTLRTFNLTTASDLAAEIGDKCKIKDYKGNYVYSYITLNTFKTAGHLLQCNAQAPNRQLVTRYSKTVQAAVEEARKETNQIISNYDLAVQMMNDLAVNAMGGYEDYEDIGTGGRVWYLSNMPITKNPSTGVCSFQPNSTVFKRSGSGFFVSRDGGQTWVNGYDITTGELVVNVLDAIGINFDWARGGTLTLGGYGNGNGVLSILDASNVEKVHGDNTGIKVGGTTGSKIFINTDGELAYYYDNAYSGKMRMSAYNYGTESSPNVIDTLSVSDFDAIRLVTENGESAISMWNENSHSGTSGIKLDSDDAIVLESDNISIGGSQNGSVSIYNLDIDGTLEVDAGYFGQDNTSYVVNKWGSVERLYWQRGILVEHEDTHEVVLDKWHTWTSGGVTYNAIILAAGNTTATFPDLDANGVYEPYIQVASGTPTPMIEDITITGTTMVVTFEAITAAQAAGNAAVIKLCKRGIS